MKAIFGAAALGLFLASCAATGGNPINNPTVRGAATGAAVGAVAGAVLGNNTGEGDAGQGAAIGAAVGAVAGGVLANRGASGGQSQSQTPAVTGPNGEPVVWDAQARRYYYTNGRDGRTYWLDGALRQ